MDTVTIKKDDLIEKIRANMGTHRSTYEKAVEVFEKEQKRLLAEMLRKAERGNPFDRLALSRLPVPEDHTRDYEVALEMLEWEVGDTVELDHTDFRRYVRDEWEWRASFAANTQAYLR